MDYCLMCNKSGDEAEAIYTNTPYGRCLCIHCAEQVVSAHAKPYFRPVSDIREEFESKFNCLIADMEDEIQDTVFASDFPTSKMARVAGISHLFTDDFMDAIGIPREKV